ncbi:carbohydrate ABC transporter permease [Propioniciclava flava]|uniref:Sugar ABC transporter permease n=1 Tax=Propioniciclava flava TaxID=2072026 RepID=A0A4V1Q7E8_9ACTN|nr:sugar ABC transporter permease [Propioniciclava flava]RXW32338.1 sugar ABC transporter permease [Propioniciclava flava]
MTAPRRRGRAHEVRAALPWLVPTLILIVGVVLYPAVLMGWTATRKYNAYGVERGPAGWDNFVGPAGALTFPTVPIPQILINTVVWVVVVVAITVALSLLLAQFLNQKFRGRKLLRLVIILPWASSVVMTATVFNYGLQTDVGLFNRLLVDTGILEAAYGFTKNPTSAFWVAVFVAIYVSLPFTTYTILAGLQAVPEDILEAAHMDGANRFQRYTRIVLPMLRPALLVATLINIINVFNSLPILKILNETPGYNTGHTTTTLIFEYKAQLGPGVASALSLVNFAFCLVVIAIYLAAVQPTKEV